MYPVLPTRLHHLTLLLVELKEEEGAYWLALSKMRSTNGSKKLAEVVRIFLLFLLFLNKCVSFKTS